MAQVEKRNGYWLYPNDGFNHAHAPIYQIPILPTTDPKTGATALDFYHVCDHHLVTLVDMTTYVVSSAALRASRVHQLEQVRPYIVKWVVGAAVVAPHAQARGAITAIKWQFDFPYPVEYFDTLDEALTWGRMRLDQAQTA